MHFRRHLPCLALAAAIAAPGVAQANGYQNLHQSAMGLGTAYAANGTGIDDVSAIFSNPASLSRFPGWNLSVGATLILPVDSFENLSATTAPAVGGFAVTDGDPSTPTQFLDTTFSGFAYASKQVTPQLTFALAFNAPWATESDYTDTAASRYTATRTSLTAYNLSPMLSYQVNDQLSVGVALNFQYYVSEFSTNLPTAAPPSQATDAMATFSGNKLAYGATVGVEYQATDQWRFGASYRTSINHEFDGEVEIDGSAAALAALAVAGISTSGSAGYEIATPWVLQFGAHGQINDKLEVFGSTAITGWSKFEDTFVNADNGLPEAQVKNGWNDAVYVAIGAGYQVTPKTKVFGGLAYDETPTPTRVRNPRAPNADRYYVGLGLSHDFSASRSLKLGYAHTFFDDAPIRLTDENNPGRGTLNGDIKIDADIFMVQYVHSF